MSSRVATIAFATVLVACGSSTTVRFKPREGTTSRAPVIVDRAILAFRDDAEVLARAGAEILGSLEINGSATADEVALRGRAIVEGTRVGASHVMIGVERTREEWEQVSPDGTRHWGRDGNGLSEGPIEGHKITHKTSRAMFIVIRVPPARWPELPEPLRPQPAADQP